MRVWPNNPLLMLLCTWDQEGHFPLLRARACTRARARPSSLHYTLPFKCNGLAHNHLFTRISRTLLIAVQYCNMGVRFIHRITLKDKTVVTVSNKKTHLAVFETCVFSRYIYLFASLSEGLSDEKIIFWIRWQNQLIFSKTLFFQKKVSYWKKSAILKKSKNLFQWSKV